MTSDLSDETPQSDVEDYSATLDIEAQMLCSLLWTPTGRVASVMKDLTPEDFYQPVHAALFEVIAGLIAAGEPHSGAYVLMTLQRDGRTSGHIGKQMVTTLTQLMTIGVPSGALEHYAAAVLTQAYRRGFRTAAKSLAEAAESLPEDQLYEHMCSIGRERRAASQRLQAIRERRAP
ncbi:MULTISPECIES: DnaB-like helicase N-terminal domain-containing protein [unclassified Gordonia (in: high G+C Gram-positive bacteria)]|uniref:DnaB-like helicase N-terminal domain-containing protein n=1 Tax=unclassified Gordonia (in: high G+C Gram-positive bacteria) TaxID=2657482 RepID=UPI000299A323|nr:MULTISPECIES: DnaB-like helicase N-terminal domain-containing protein [unclassified Gordonia (in: high G+C Gram-positive bacteria)]ADK68882.2 probable replicative DNA helicase [Gordonia sp. KTR9]